MKRMVKVKKKNKHNYINSEYITRGMSLRW